MRAMKPVATVMLALPLGLLGNHGWAQSSAAATFGGSAWNYSTSTRPMGSHPT